MSVLFPSDLDLFFAHASERPESRSADVPRRFRLAGRFYRSSPSEGVLRDAQSTVEVRTGRSALQDGTWVLVEVEASEGGFELLQVLRTHPATRHTRETARFVDGGVGRALSDRALALRATRRYFDDERFLEVETPTVVPSPGLDLHLDAQEILGGGALRYLITSPEYQMKRLLVGGIPRCFQIVRTYRRGELGAHHNPEFSMLEWYRAEAPVAEVMADTERIVSAVNDMVGSERSRLSGLSLSRPFERLSVRSAFERFCGVSEASMLAMARSDEESFFRLLCESVEPALKALGRPVFLERYPVEMASLARACPDDERYAERFELYASGVELCNGFGELCDPDEQLRRFQRDQRERAAHGKPVYPIDERFVEALREGMPEASGNAMGFDRLVMLSRGDDCLAESLAFPAGEL